MDENGLIDSLREGTELVARAYDGRITLREFVERYGSFYHYNALDGHEALTASERELLARYAAVCELHALVQNLVVDALYSGPDDRKAEFMAAGRIDENGALHRLKEIGRSHLSAALLELGTAPGAVDG